MTFDLSRCHWWNPTLDELCVQGLAWADRELKYYHEAWEKAYFSIGFKLIEAHEFCEFVKDAMPDYSVCDEMKQFPYPPGFKPRPLIGDSWDKPMRHWDD